jgi:hypothetical protein
MVEVIANALTWHPRSQQVRIGPSEIGAPCERRLGYKLAATPEVNERGIAWKPAIGTAVHSAFEVMFYNADLEGTTWLTETRVTVGEVGGVPITGQADLFHIPTGTVIDHKTTSRNKLRDYKAHGPGEQYRAQAHLYGRGFAAQGRDVAHVAIMFWTREGEFTDRYLWTEPYDEQIAIDALNRLHRIGALIDALTPAAALPLLPTADGPCTWCPWWRPGSTDLGAACPGDAAVQARTAAPLTLADALGN